MRAVIFTLALLAATMALASAKFTTGAAVKIQNGAAVSINAQASQSAPTISSLVSANGCAGSWVEIVGANFTSGGTSIVVAVDLNGTSLNVGQWNVDSATVMAAVIPNGATTGPWHVQTTAGRATSGSFTVTTASSCGGFACDLTNPNALCSLMTASRTGSPIIAQTGLSSVQSWSSATGYIVENIGDGGGWGTVTMDARTNQVASSASITDFTNAGWASNGVTVTTPLSSAGPVGSGLTQTQLLRGATGSCSSLSIATGGTANNCIGITSVWTADSPLPPSPLHGAIFGQLGVTGAFSFPAGGAWRRTFGTLDKAHNGGPLGDTIGIVISGESSVSNGSPTCDNTSGGSIYATYAQSVAACDNGKVPVINGASTGAAVLQVATGQLANLINGNDMRFKACYLVDNFFATSTNDTTETTIPHLLSFQTADGVSMWEWNQSIFGWFLNGSVSSTTNGDQGYLSQALYAPTEECIEFSSSPTAGYGYAEETTNGAVQMTVAYGTFAAQTMHVPTSFYLGSYLNAGTRAGFATHWTRVQRLPTNVAPNQCETVILGDSHTSRYLQNAETSGAIYNIDQARSRAGICDFSFPGKKWSDQKASFDTWVASGKNSTNVTAVIFAGLGTNDVDPGNGNLTDSQIATNANSTIADVHGVYPSAKLLLYPHPPVNCVFPALQQKYLNNYYNDTQGTGPNNITDPGGGVLIRETWPAQIAQGGQVATTTLTGSMGLSDTTANVASTTGAAASGVIRIESEVITYASKTTNTYAGLVRGTNGTSAATHAINVDVAPESYCWQTQYLEPGSTGLYVDPHDNTLSRVTLRAPKMNADLVSAGVLQ